MRQRRRNSPLLMLLTAAALALFLAAWLRLPAPFPRILFFVLTAWCGAAVLTLLCFLAVTLDDLGDVVWTAVCGSAPAMWLAPATLLLAMPERMASGIALALIASAVCLLAAQRPPRRLGRTEAAAPQGSRPVLFRVPAQERGSLAGSRPAVTVGAFSLQAGLWCWYAEYRLAAALFIALTAALWTRSWVSRVTARENWKARSPISSLGAVAFALLLTLGAGVASYQTQADAAADGTEMAASLFEQSRRTLTRLARPEPPKPVRSGRAGAPPERAREPGTIGLKGVPGVILRNTKPQPQWLRLAPVRPGASVISELLTFDFTGEYHLFRSSSGQVPEGSTVETGTPLEAVYVTTNGGTMETQAYQPLIPPVDFTRCGLVRLTLRSGEVLPCGATLQLLTAAGAEVLGTQIFGMDLNAEETLQYFVPDARRQPVQALRLIFHHDPSQGAKSTRVSVLRFALVPRSY